MHNFTFQSLIQMDLHFENEKFKTTMLYITKPMQYIQTQSIQCSYFCHTLLKTKATNSELVLKYYMDIAKLDTQLTVLLLIIKTNPKQ